jgi:hypothetical protein
MSNFRLRASVYKASAVRSRKSTETAARGRSDGSQRFGSIIHKYERLQAQWNDGFGS